MLRRNYLVAVALLFLMIGGLSSCVSSRRYKEEVSAKEAAEKNASEAERKRQEIQEELSSVQGELSKLKASHKELTSDYELLQERYNQQQRLNKDLQASYDKLLALNEKLKEEAASKKRELSEELSIKRRELERRERELKAEQERLEQLRKELQGKDANITDLEKYKKELEADLAARERRVKELEAAIAERDAKANALRAKLLEALKGFKDAGDLDVEIRDGKVYVSLSQKLLFSSGSARVDRRGVSALETLSGVLNRNKDLSILIEGHTDSDGDAKMNWDLSTDRALAVSQVLIKNQVDPARITAAGRGEHAPKASNDTTEGKAKNRRTEIILEPQLNEIMGILSQD
ncbi:OmpA family protein [Saprospira grandis]|uniref:OmpA/MotB domain protein n=1 Tax=Saprospira grandis (strain Lewin) TaxID=984262 RepID=H6L1G8_SAPGL|nr:OmpA family protein [Saprospira grandis]AFC24612.1 OmpA/MotB domain protein [Saprospira grandis str. Lewin]